MQHIKKKSYIEWRESGLGVVIREAIYINLFLLILYLNLSF